MQCWNALISSPRFAKLHCKRARPEVMIRTNDPKRVSRTLDHLEFEPKEISYYPTECHFLCSEFDAVPVPGCENHRKLEAKFKLPMRDAKMLLGKRDEGKNGARERELYCLQT
ncbi:hypothetical protein L6164_031164 [Bauhinia variegata]|uniref:Uncharacterized protein n=1 Tax=Bauhinia variegata TaxID=167791 RepID=A0ACB9LFH0_BAUVA|nr:hypothetical protein L6164_031164 [Bauhinia variegata]